MTYFFNGGREESFPGEERVMVQSPKGVATYDLAPEMSEKDVAKATVTAIESGKFDFVLVNFANPDMVGHTGILDAADQGGRSGGRRRGQDPSTPRWRRTARCSSRRITAIAS